jgi:glycosyl transferase family 25
MNHPLNDFFDRVFVISIKRNYDRIELFKKLHPQLHFEIFDGIDGKELFPELEFVSQFPKDFFEIHNLQYERCKNWNKGQLGCAMSNLFIQKKIIADCIPKALILEDDALIIDENITCFQSSLKELPLDWELFYLGYNDFSRVMEYNWFIQQSIKIKYLLKAVKIEGKSSRTFSKRFFSKSFTKSLNIPGILGGTHAYAITIVGAKKIVKLDSPLKYGFDTTLMHANYHKIIRSFSLKERLIIPNENFETSLTN